MLAESLVSLKSTSKLEGEFSPKVKFYFDSEKVENSGVRLHPVFNSTTDDWMYLDESPRGGSSSSSASRPQPEILPDETPPDVPVILMNPDDAEIDAIDAQLPKVERRMRKKSVDPVTATALKEKKFTTNCAIRKNYTNYT